MYTLLIGLGAALPLAWQVWRTHDERVVTYALVAGSSAVFAGRIGYVAIHWGYFNAHREQIVSLASPGYSEHLALLAVWGVGLLAQSPHALRAASRAASYALLAITVATFIGIGASLGCISQGCAFGKEVFWQDGVKTLGWLLRADWPDAFGVRNPRWPTQALMAGWLLFCWLIVLLLQRRYASITDARLPMVWLLLFAIGDSANQLLRADETLFIRNIRIEQYFDVILFILSLYRLIHSYPPTTPQT